MRPVALTIGDPAGIGPEIIVKAWQALKSACPFVLIADPRHVAGLGVPLVEVDDPAEASDVSARALPVLAHDFPGDSGPARPDPQDAAAVIAVIDRAVALARSGAVCAVTTAPITKKALIDGAGFGFPGHTEYLAHLAGAKRAVMMLASDALRVVPATIHIPLAAVPGALTPALLEDTIRITRAALQRDFGIDRPRLAVTGLNPHAGEGGTMGREDLEVIAPVVARLAAEGLDVTGPTPADTMFHAGARAGYDAAIAMYHDQALIPVKTLAFDAAVNVTLGLPFIRTSPDHGTAYDIAGRGVARPDSLIAALRLAHRMATTRLAPLSAP